MIPQATLKQRDPALATEGQREVYDMTIGAFPDLEIAIVRTDPFGFIHFEMNAPLPRQMQGSFTQLTTAQAAVKSWLASNPVVELDKKSVYTNPVIPTGSKKSGA